MSSVSDEMAVPRETLRDIEDVAVELAAIAGAEITKALGSLLAVKYKTTVNADDWRDPVSEVDDRVERMIRERVARQFPGHDVIGEEIVERPARGSAFVWSVDPIDGTANFVNGFPMFAASIGILHRGVPVAGAVWCTVSHALRAGVYHCAAGGKLRFDGADVTPRVNPAVRRRLIGVPVAPATAGPWETRKTGSAALECAMVAAGLMQGAHFMAPNIWDIAGGLALVLAAGGVAHRRSDDRSWGPMERFETSTEHPDLRSWRSEVILGEPTAVAQMCKAA